MFKHLPFLKGRFPSYKVYEIADHLVDIIELPQGRINFIKTEIVETLQGIGPQYFLLEPRYKEFYGAYTNLSYCLTTNEYDEVGKYLKEIIPYLEEGPEKGLLQQEFPSQECSPCARLLKLSILLVAVLALQLLQLRLLCDAELASLLKRL